MEIGKIRNDSDQLKSLESEPVNVEFVGRDGNRHRNPKAAPGNDEYMDRDATNQDIQQGNSTQVVKLVYDEVDPS